MISGILRNDKINKAKRKVIEILDEVSHPSKLSKEEYKDLLEILAEYIDDSLMAIKEELKSETIE